MANYYATMALAAQTGESADVNTNIFAFIGPNVFTPTEGEFVKDTIGAFYEAVETASVALYGRAQSGHVCKIYAATTATPNYPIDESAFAFSTAPGALQLPPEVSLCVSYANDSATIVPRARRRGRIYLSGFNSGVNSAGRPTSTAYETIAQEYANYCDALNAEPDFTACVWSRVNATLYPIERVWCDNEWDTQRSRGGKATTRDTHTITP